VIIAHMILFFTQNCRSSLQCLFICIIKTRYGEKWYICTWDTCSSKQ
jgi:hypothetical protein